MKDLWIERQMQWEQLAATCHASGLAHIADVQTLASSALSAGAGDAQKSPHSIAHTALPLGPAPSTCGPRPAARKPPRVSFAGAGVLAAAAKGRVGNHDFDRRLCSKGRGQEE